MKSSHSKRKISKCRKCVVHGITNNRYYMHDPVINLSHLIVIYLRRYTGSVVTFIKIIL